MFSSFLRAEQLSSLQSRSARRSNLVFFDLSHTNVRRADGSQTSIFVDRMERKMACAQCSACQFLIRILFIRACGSQCIRPLPSLLLLCTIIYRRREANELKFKYVFLPSRVWLPIKLWPRTWPGIKWVKERPSNENENEDVSMKMEWSVRSVRIHQPQFSNSLICT